MKLRETIEILATPEQVWPFLADPAKWPEWQHKVVQVQRSRSGEIIPDEQFRAVFQMKRRQTDTQVAVRTAEPPKEIVLRQHFDFGQRARQVEVTFKLERAGSRTRVTQILDHSQSGIPLLLRLLIWFIYRFGRSTGPQPLRRLRQLVEAEHRAQSMVP